jgi:hypothetical protein
LRRAFFRFPVFHPIQHPLFQEQLKQVQQAAVGELFLDLLGQQLSVERVEEFRDVNVYDMHVPRVEQLLYLPQRIFAA